MFSSSSSSTTTLVLHITAITLLTLTLSTTITPVVNGSHHPQVLTGPRSWSSLLKKAFDLGRTAKWNEFIEEKNGVGGGGGGGGGPFSGDHSSSSNKNGTTTTTNSSSSFRKSSSSSSSQHQNLIDETKDPDSPYYISMISSNIGGGHSAAAVAQSTGTGSNTGGNRNGSNGSSSSSNGSKNKDSNSNNNNSGLVSKLFSYAFAPSTPSRVMATTKRPLVTYINVSNLEEHEQVVENSASKLGLLSGISSPSSSAEASSQQQQLQLLNNADHTGTGVLGNHRDHSHHHVHQVLSTAAAAAAATGTATGSKRRLPECATQQVCAAHYVKSNHTQRLCECAQDFKWNCEDSSSHLHDHEPTHTIDLTRKQEYKTQRNNLEAYTQVKMCENLKSIKPCKTPTDWTIMALQSERTGKAHYVVVCKCPDEASFEGPFTHKHPPYARFPGIRVYGMLCNQGVRKSKDPKALEIDQNSELPEFPWELAYAVINATTTQGFW